VVLARKGFSTFYKFLRKGNIIHSAITEINAGQTGRQAVGKKKKKNNKRTKTRERHKSWGGGGFNELK